MPRFVADAVAFDPYRAFQFCVRWNGRVVAGFSEASGLTSALDAAQYRAGGSPAASRKVPGSGKFDAITLVRGISHDPEFCKWASQTMGRGARAASRDVRRDIVVEMRDETGRRVGTWKILRCRVWEFPALPEFDDGTGAAVAIEVMKLEHEGWVRDTAVAEPGET